MEVLLKHCLNIAIAVRRNDEKFISVYKCVHTLCIQKLISLIKDLSMMLLKKTLLDFPAVYVLKKILKVHSTLRFFKT